MTESHPRRRLRVLHLGHGRIFGGIETVLVNIARAQELCPELESEFAICYDGRLADELRDAGVRVHRLGEVRVSRPTSVWRARKCLRAVLADRAFDVVISHAAWPHAVLGPAVRQAGVSLVFWQHDVLRGTYWAERWAARCRPNAAISNSLFTSRTLDAVFPGVPNAVVYCPVASSARAAETTEQPSVRREFETAQHAVVIVQVSRMQAWKGQLQLVEALARIRDRGDWTCWFVGGAQGPDDAKYEQQVRGACTALGLSERVVFCGQRADVGRVLAAADIFCQPNVGPEPFGIVFIEALYAGLPVVANALGAAPEIVNEECGVLVPPGDLDALSTALRRLITSGPQRRRLGAAGPARARSLCDPATRLRQLHHVLSTTPVSC